MSNWLRTHSKIFAVLLLLGLTALVSGCATAPTAVASDTQLAPEEGLVAMRLIHIGDVPISSLSVVTESTGKSYPLRAIQYGQTSTQIYFGRLPAGRYQPQTLVGSRNFGTLIETVTVPLQKQTGKFDVEARRITDLGTVVYTPLEDNAPVTAGNKKQFRFALPLLPASIATEALVKARYPLLANAVQGKSNLSWVAGTVPEPPAKLMQALRQLAPATTKPSFAHNGDLFVLGQLGVIDRYAQGTGKPQRLATDSVHAIQSLLVLKNGSLLAGGEEGFLSVSSDSGTTWKKQTLLGAEDVVLHLAQAPDGHVYLVIDRDREVVVFQSPPSAAEWKELKRIPSDREQSAFTQTIGQAKKFLPDHAASTDTHLAIYTRSNQLISLEFRTGKWEAHPTPRAFHHSLKATRDGLLVGIAAQHWVYTSTDYGRNWARMESYINMTEPYFIDRNRGVMLAAEFGLKPVFKFRSTDDGGKSWKAGPDVASYWKMLDPLWTSPDGKTLYTANQWGISRSDDQGGKWRAP